MKLRPKSTIEQHFSEIEDPRVERTKRHLLIDLTPKMFSKLGAIN